MRYTFLFLFFLVYINGQERYPAGLSTPLIWIKGEGDKVINSNAAFTFNEEHKGFSWKLTPEQAEKYSLFIVYKNTDSKEQILWNLSENKKQKIIATTQRINDYTASQHRIYPQKLTREKVQIHYYQHYKKLSSSERTESKARENILSVGNKENTTSFGEQEDFSLSIGNRLEGFPPITLTGDIAEILVYDRVLSTIEMQQVASYLAIKYGISLHQFQFRNYYNSEGNKIWDYHQHKAFNQNITAIGIDTNGNLSQFKSQNSNDEQVILMEILSKKISEIPENYFVFWSDNGGGLSIKKQKEGNPKGIGRVWQLDLPKNMEIPLKWYFNPNSLEKPSTEKSQEQEVNIKEPKPYYWLISDISGRGDFRPENTTYTKLIGIEHNQVTAIEDILSTLYQKADRQSLTTENLHYTIWQAPEMFAHLDIEQGKCQSSQEGKVYFNIIGGKAPYQIKLRNFEEKNSNWNWKTSESKGENPIHLNSGKYIYTITDAQNNEYSQEIYITDEDAPMPKLNKEYIIKAPIVLDPKKDLPNGNYSFEWYKNEKLISKNSTYLLNEKGDYELRMIDANGCKSSSKFSAYSADNAEINSSIVLYPNPSKDGHFSLMASFPKEVSGGLQIYSAEGRLIKEQYFYNEKQIHYTDYLPMAGVYFITIQTTLGRETKKLIIQ